MTLLAYRYALDPTPRQERALRCQAGAARVAFNGGLARVTANLAQREAERTYGIGDDELTPALSWSLYSLRKAWNEGHHQVPGLAPCVGVAERAVRAGGRVRPQPVDLDLPMVEPVVQ